VNGHSSDDRPCIYPREEDRVDASRTEHTLTGGWVTRPQDLTARPTGRTRAAPSTTSAPNTCPLGHTRRGAPPPLEWREYDAPQERAPPREYSKGTTRWRGDRRSRTHSITATLAGHYRGGLHYTFVRGFPRVHSFGSFEIYTVPKFPQRTGNRDLVFAPRHLLIAPFVLRLVVKNY